MDIIQEAKAFIQKRNSFRESAANNAKIWLPDNDAEKIISRLVDMLEWKDVEINKPPKNSYDVIVLKQSSAQDGTEGNLRYGFGFWNNSKKRWEDSCCTNNPIEWEIVRYWLPLPLVGDK